MKKTFRGILFLAQAVSFVAAGAVFGAAWPHVEGFNYAVPSDLNGQGGWVTVTNLYGTNSIATGCALVQNTSARTNGGTAVAFSNLSASSYARLSLDFSNYPTVDPVWADFYGMPVYGETAVFPTSAVAVFYFNTNGQTVAYNSNIAVTVAADEDVPVVPSNAWTRFTVRLQYSTKKWDLWVNGTNVVSQFNFYNSSQPGFTNMSVIEGSTNSPSRLDDLTVSTNAGVIPFVRIARATGISDTQATLNGELSFSPSAVDCYVLWGTVDGGTNRALWQHSEFAANQSMGTFSITTSYNVDPDTLYYYRCCASNSSGMYWSEPTYVWMAQTRQRGAWHLASLPTPYGVVGGTKAFISSNAGVALAGGMVTSPTDINADFFYIQSNNTSVAWGYGYLNANTNWVGLNTATNIEIQPGMGFWLKRSSNGDLVTYAGLTGPKPGAVPAVVFPGNKWRVFGWPYAAVGTTSVPLGWGFSNGTKSATMDNADLLFAEYSNRWYLLYLNTDGKWYRHGDVRAPTTVKLQPGKGYYYYHRGSDMTWTPPQY